QQPQHGIPGRRVDLRLIDLPIRRFDAEAFPVSLPDPFQATGSDVVCRERESLPASLWII
ncbi:MAG: hypothetical protein D6732_24795, partial [Methanobacteriota archaeon]